jgi:diketogulonate reductase-like aldo/keto reductase
VSPPFSKPALTPSYSIDDLERVLASGRIKPVVNQIILNPHVYASTIPLLEYMAKHNIVAEGYSPLKPLRDGTSPGLVKVVEKIGKEHKTTPEQILMAWSKAKGCVSACF